MKFWNVFTIYVLLVNDFKADIPTKLRLLSDLENPDQLPVQEVFGWSDDCASSILLKEPAQPDG